MSIKLMSAIFETEMRDLPCTKHVHHKDGTDEYIDYSAKASTAKFVLLAIADHANDYGQGAYPGLTKLERKTGFSRQGIIDTIEALRANGLLSIDENPSMLGTNNYTINIRAFAGMAKEAEELPELVKPLDQGSQATLPAVVKPLDHNHPSTILQPDIYTPPSKKIKPPPDPVVQALITQGIFPNPQTDDYLRDWRKSHTDERIIQAIEKSAGTNHKYIDTMLLGWEANGYPPTREERIAAARKGKNNAHSNNPSSTPKAKPVITEQQLEQARRVLARQREREQAHAGT